VIPQVFSAPPAAAAAAEKPPSALPAVAIVFDGRAGDAFADALVNGGKYRVVDRSVLQKVLSELKTGTRSRELRESRRVLGASYFFVGSSRPFQGQIFMNVQMIETETTEVVKTHSVQGDPASEVKLAEELAAMF